MPTFSSLPPSWSAVPSGAEVEWWRTVPTERTILVVGRGPTTTLWLYDLLDELLADPRIQVVFTVDEEDPDTFSRGLADLSSVADAVFVSWSRAVTETFDLAISASRTGSLDQLSCPLLLGPHGASIGKRNLAPNAQGIPMPRVQAGWRTQTATTVMVAHPLDRSLLPDLPREAAVAVTGDPCLDRLRASEPLREHFRKDLGLDAGQCLVLVSATWGPDSLLAGVPDLGTRLASELPFDRYRIAMVVHPNTWVAHGMWQVQSWMRRSTDAGVLALEPWRNAWRSALVASDVVVHDHGSVALYAAALDKPVMVGRFDSESTISASPIAELALRAPRFRFDAPAQPQIDAALAAHTPGRCSSIADRITGAPDEAFRLHQGLVYDLIDLDPPGTEPRTLAVSRPPHSLPPVFSHHVRTHVTDSRSVIVDRFPARTPPPPPVALGPQPQHHLISDVCDPDTQTPPNAAIVFDSGGVDTPSELLRRFGGCRYAISGSDGTDVIIWHADGRRFRLRAATSPAGIDLSVGASACYAIETSGQSIAAVTDCNVVLGDRHLRFSVRQIG